MGTSSSGQALDSFLREQYDVLQYLREHMDAILRVANHLTPVEDLEQLKDEIDAIYPRLGVLVAASDLILSASEAGIDLLQAIDAPAQRAALQLGSAALLSKESLVDASALGTTNNTLSALSEYVDTLAANLSLKVNQASLDALTAQVNDFQASLTAQVNTLISQAWEGDLLVQVNAKVTAVESAVTGIEDNLATQTQRIDSLAATTAAQGPLLASQQADLDALGNRVTNTESDQAATAATVVSVQEQLTTVAEQQATTAANVATLTDGVTAVSNQAALTDATAQATKIQADALALSQQLETAARETLSERVDASDALVEYFNDQVANLTNSLSSSGNLLWNAGFEADLKNWNLESVGSNWNAPSMERALVTSGDVPALLLWDTDAAAVPTTDSGVSSAPVAVNEGQTYILSGYIASEDCSSRLEYRFLDINRQEIGYGLIDQSDAPVPAVLGKWDRPYKAVLIPVDLAERVVYITMQLWSTLVVGAQPKAWLTRPMIEEAVAGQITPSNWVTSSGGLAAGLLEEAGLRADADIAVAQAAAADATAKVAAAAGDLQGNIDNLQATVNSTIEDLATEAQSRIDGDTATAANAADALAAEVINRGTAISSEATTRINADNALSTRIDTVSATADDNTAAIQTEQEARVAADSAEVNERTLLATQLRGNYTGSDLNSITSGLLFQERQARVSEDEAMAQQLTLLSVGVGEQFDYASIWYFASSVEGWTGNNGLTVAASWIKNGVGSNPTMLSPVNLGINATEYPQVRLRIRKTGNPLWDGGFWWINASGEAFGSPKNHVIAEPEYDTDGIAVISFDAGWTGTIYQVRVDLANSTDASNYFEVDWVAIGRPAPGASSAALSAEQTARAAADSAEVTSRELLAVKLLGQTDPTGLTIDTVTSGLLADERAARITADAAEVSTRELLEARVDDAQADILAVQTASVNADEALGTRIDAIDVRLPVGSGNLASEASVSAETTARVTADDALADRTTAMESRMPAGTGELTTTARIAAEESTRATADTALSNRTTLMEARMPGGVGMLATDAQIITEQGTRAAADNAMATDILALQAGIGAILGPEIIPNWDFNDGTTGVINTGTTSTVTDGVLTAVAVDGGADRVEWQIAGLTVGETYHMQASVRRGAQGTTQRFMSFTIGTIAAIPIVDGPDFQVYDITFDAIATSGRIRLYAANTVATSGAAGDTVECEWISLKQVTNTATADAINATNVVVTQQGEEITSVADRTTALETTVNDPATGVDATAAALATTSAAVSDNADGIAANLGQINTLKGTVNDPSTGVVASANRLDAAELAITQQDAFAQSTADDLNLLEAEVHNATTGLNARAKQTDFTTLKARVDTVGGGMEVMADNVSTLESGLSDLSGEVDTKATVADLNTTNSNLNTLTGEVDTQASQISTVTATANAAAKAYYQPGIPASAKVGDTWTDSDSNPVQSYVCKTAYASAGTLAKWQAVDAAAAALAATKADATVVTALTTRVTNVEGVNTSQGTSLVALNNSINATQQVLPATFKDSGTFFNGSYIGDPAVKSPLVPTSNLTFVDVAGVGKVVQYGAASGDVCNLGVITLQAGRKYRLSVTHRTLTGTRTCTLYLIGLKDDYSYQVVSGNSTSVQSTVAWTTTTVELSADVMIAAGCKYVRGLARMAADTDLAQVSSILLENISEVVNAGAISTLDTRLTSAEGINTAQATDLTGIHTQLNDATTGLDAKAAITTTNAISARLNNTGAGRSVEQVASALVAVETSVNSATTGLATKATIASLNTTNSNLNDLTGDVSSQADDIAALEATVNNATTGVAATAAGLAATNVTVGTQGNTLTAQGSSINSLTAALTGGGNLLPNSEFDNLDYWSANDNTTGLTLEFSANDGTIGDGHIYTPYGTRAMLMSMVGTPAAGTVARVSSSPIPVDHAKKYIASARYTSLRCGARVYMFYRDAAGGWVDAQSSPVGAANGLYAMAPAYPELANFPLLFKGEAYDIPSNVATIEFVFELVGTGSANPYIWWIMPQLEQAVTGQLNPSPWSPSAAKKASASVVETAVARVSTLEQRGTGVNQLVNSSFAGNTDGWTLGVNTTGQAVVPAISDGNFGDGNQYLPAGIKSMLVTFAGTAAAGTYADIQATPIPVKPGERLMAHVQFNAFRCNAMVYWWVKDSAGNNLGYYQQSASTAAPNRYATSPAHPLLDTLPRLEAAGVVPANAATAVMVVRLLGTGEANPSLWWTLPMFERMSATQTEPSPYNMGGAESFASWSLVLNADHKVAGIYALNDGVQSNLELDFDTVTITSTDGSAAITKGTSVYRADGYMTVIGAGFGVNSDLMKWFGPDMDVSLCSKANAISYEDTTGHGSYPTLTVGDIEFNASSDSTAVPNTLSMLNNNTDGANKVITARYTASGSVGGKNSTVPTGSATLSLWRKVGAGSFVQLGATQTLTMTGSVFDAGGGYYTRSLSGTKEFTFTDTDASLSTHTYEWRLTARTNSIAINSQSMTLKSLE